MTNANHNGIRARLTAIPGPWVNVRQSADVNSADLGDLRVGDTATIFDNMAAGWWYVVADKGITGYVARQGGKVVFTALDAAPAPLDDNLVTIPNVPYASEFDWKVGWTALCGETSLYMLLLYDRQWKHFLRGLPSEITPFTIANYLGKGAKDFTSLVELSNAADGYGLNIHLDTGLWSDPFALLTGEVDKHHPIIALIDYSKLPTRWDKNFGGGHILVVVGYSDTSIVVNDPDAQGTAGKYIRYPRADFAAAWGAMGNQALVFG